MEPSVSLEDCLKLLKGERDEQVLAGLLLVTKSCKGTDFVSLQKVYDALSKQFLDRLLMTGMGKGKINSGGSNNREAYLQLSVTVIATLCRVPEIASSNYMLTKIPLILDIMSKESSLPEECYEFLYLVSSSCEDGITALYESGGIKVLASQMSTFADGSRNMEFAIRLVQLILNKLSLANVSNDYVSDLSTMVVTTVRQFALLHNHLKFEALHLLSTIFSENLATTLTNALHASASTNWPNYMRVGVVAILQNRVAPAEKLHALILAESTISIMGEEWLVGPLNLPNMPDTLPADRCLLLILESSRVEVTVLLNELAYMNFEANKNSSSTAEVIPSKQRNLCIAYSLVEKIIKLMSNTVENEGNLLDESTLLKVIKSLNETINVILEFLQDAKDHGKKKGNDLLASVRVIGSYLAETPTACEEKFTELLEYMLSIEGEDESSSFCSVRFLLPMLCQITMELEGCKVLASSGGFRSVAECLKKLIASTHHLAEDSSCIFLACDTLLNILLNTEHVNLSIDESVSVGLLKALSHWAGDVDDVSVILMASSICSLVLEYMSKNNHSSFDPSLLRSLAQLFAKSFAHGQDSGDAKDLFEIVASGYPRWADRYPFIKDAVERS